MSENYTDFLQFQDMLARSNDSEQLLGYLEWKLEDLGIKDAQHMFSVGPGPATVDETLVKMMPNIESYTAVEIDERYVEITRKKMESILPKKEAVDVYHGKLEDYPGPNHSMDLILLVHVVYYFEDLAKEMQRMLSWLKPGGKAIIIVNIYQGTSKTEWESPINLFEVKDVKEKLAKFDFTEDVIDYQIDVTHPEKNNYGFISLQFGGRPITDTEGEKFMRSVENNITVTPGGARMLNCQQAAIILGKQ